MARKRKAVIRPWCWYCEIVFETEKQLIEHQRKRHYTCQTCDRKHKTLTYLIEHSMYEHKEKITTVPYALPGRDSIDVIIRGTEGIPEKDAAIHSRKIEAQFEEEQMDIRNSPSGETGTAEDSPNLSLNQLPSTHAHAGVAPAQPAKSTIYQGGAMPPPIVPGYPPMIYPHQMHNGAGPYPPNFYGHMHPLAFHHMHHGFPPPPQFPVPGIHQKVSHTNQYPTLRYNSPLRPENNPPRYPQNTNFRPKVDPRPPSNLSDSTRATHTDSLHTYGGAKRPLRPQLKDSPQSTDSLRGSRLSRPNGSGHDSRDSKRPRTGSFNSRAGPNPHSLPRPQPEPAEKLMPRPKMTPVFKHPVNNLFSPHAFSPPRQAEHKANRSKLGINNDYEGGLSSSTTNLQQITNGSSVVDSSKKLGGNFVSPPSPTKIDPALSNAARKREDFSRRFSDNGYGGLTPDFPLHPTLDPDFVLDVPQQLDEFSIQDNEIIICAENEKSPEELRASHERYIYREADIRKKVELLNSSVDAHIAIIRKLARKA